MAVTFYATNNFTGDGSQTVWNINFADGYLSTADVKARYVDNTGAFVDIAITSVVGNVVTITPAQPSGRVFSIYRDTTKSAPLVDFADGAILNETNLDVMATQAVMVAAEASDLANGLIGVAYSASGDAALALSTANTAAATANSAISTANAANSTAASAATVAGNAATVAANASSAAAAATSAATAATTAANTATTTANAATTAANAATSTANTALSTANTASTNASNAVSTANTANSNASAAVTTAGAAQTAAANAVSVANGVDGKAQTALDNSAAAVSTANTASTNATTALNTANAIDGKAQTALDNSVTAVNAANNAVSVANTVDSKAQTALDNSITAESNAATAVSTANAAQSAVASKANNGANSDITSLSGLTTPLSIGQGGTGQGTAPLALAALGVPQGTAADQVLKWNGTAWTAAAAPAGGMSLLKQTTITASGTFNLQAGTKFMRVFCLGGGGGGGSSGNPGAGQLLMGKSGQASVGILCNVDMTNVTTRSASVIVGGGGTAGNAPTNPGSGGASTFTMGTNQTITSYGGFGGGNASYTLSTFPVIQKAIGSGNSGYIGVGWPAGACLEFPSPKPALNGYVFATGTGSWFQSIEEVRGPYGVDSVYTGNSVPNPNLGYGSAGRGAVSSNAGSTYAGAIGNAGVVIVEEFG